MAKKVLIIGYGRAGKRHAKIAKDEFGLDVYLYDPANKRQPRIDGFHNCLFKDNVELYRNLTDFDYAVIATPPRWHFEHLFVCIHAGLKVLCEKPLCDIGHLDEVKSLPAASPVMVAYNYRYHPKLTKLRGKCDEIELYCSQYRDSLPEWGLLLDHCSHDLDIARMVLEYKKKTIYYAKYSGSGMSQRWDISMTGGIITEKVANTQSPRIATLTFQPPLPDDADLDYITEIDIDPDPQMFTDMWQAFLDGKYYPDLQEAIKTQELLEQCYRLNARLWKQIINILP